MARKGAKEKEFQKALAGIDLPVLTLDNRWHKLFTQRAKTPEIEALADEIRSLGVRPGIWARLLDNQEADVTSDMRILRGGERVYLDPTHPKVQPLVRGYIEKCLTHYADMGFDFFKLDFLYAASLPEYGGKTRAAAAQDA